VLDFETPCRESERCDAGLRQNPGLIMIDKEGVIMREMARKTNRSVRTPVDIQATLFAGVVKQDVRLHDLSMHGAGLKGNIPLEFGNEVRVRFHIPNHGTTVVVEALADVRHLEDRRKGGAMGGTIRRAGQPTKTSAWGRIIARPIDTACHAKHQCSQCAKLKPL